MIDKNGGFGGGNENPNINETGVKKVEKAKEKELKIECPNKCSSKVEFDVGNETTECHCPDCHWTAVIKNYKDPKKIKILKTVFEGVSEVKIGDGYEGKRLESDENED